MVAFRAYVIGGLGRGDLDQIVTVELVFFIETPVSNGIKTKELISLNIDPRAADGFLILATMLRKGFD